MTNREHILERMTQKRDNLDLIVKPPESSELAFQPYLPNPMLVVAAADHEFAHRKAIPLAEIVAENSIIRERGSGTRVAAKTCVPKPVIKSTYAWN